MAHFHGESRGPMIQRPNYRIFCKRPGTHSKDYCITVRHGKLCLALPTINDPHQLWYKDAASAHSFLIVNEATEKCVKYNGRHVQLELAHRPSHHSQNHLVVWIESSDKGYGYRYLRSHDDHNMVMDAWTGNIHDGTKIGIHPENKRLHGDLHRNADNQLWKFVLASGQF